MDSAASIDRAPSSLRAEGPAIGERIEATLRRLEIAEPEILSLVPDENRDERLRRSATALQDRHPSAALPLLGALAGIKDIFHVDGFPTRAGSQLPPEALAGPQASSVTRLLDDGAIVLGKTVTAEFAYFAPGPTRNPRHRDHTPGGSSSGSAAAVAAGLCPFALGTQTIGSIIRPASFCGVVGFKPSYGRIAADGVIPLSPSLDHVGIIAFDVATAREVARSLFGEWHDVPRGAAPTLGIPAGPYFARAEAVSKHHFDLAVAALSRAGVAVRTVAVLSDFDEVVDRHQVILAAEAAQVHAEWFRQYSDLYHPRTAQLIRDGQGIDSVQLEAARKGQAVLRQTLQAVMDRVSVHVWVAPSTVGPAPKGLESTGDPILNLPWTQAGLPAITIPCGVDFEGLPLGLQLIGRWNEDEQLLTWAEDLAALLPPVEFPAVQPERAAG
jgi:Asp-tRNA(Asn)/Glu-tRNA(Gln) amidotransferase A subunit family amidase